MGVLEYFFFDCFGYLLIDFTLCLWLNAVNKSGIGFVDFDLV